MEHLTQTSMVYLVKQNALISKRMHYQLQTRWQKQEAICYLRVWVAMLLSEKPVLEENFPPKPLILTPQRPIIYSCLRHIVLEGRP